MFIYIENEQLSLHTYIWNKFISTCISDLKIIFFKSCFHYSRKIDEFNISSKLLLNR